MEERKNEQTRRAFFTKTVPVAIGILGVGGLLAEACKPAVEDEEKVSVLTPDGKLVEVDKDIVDASVNRQKASSQDIFKWMENPSKD